MNRFREWIYRFMRDRYGYDELNYTLFAGAVIADLAGIFTGVQACMAVSLILLILVVSRALSRNRVKRSTENRIFRERTVVPRRLFKAWSMGRRDKAHRYYLCPKCHQICRVPRGRGEVSVHCPKCGMEFTRRS